MNADRSDVAAAAAEMLPRLRRWDSASWSVAAQQPDARRWSRRPSRADVAAAVVQRLADLAADAEGQPRRTVPRVAGVNLADQLTVMVDDILRTGDPATLRAAAIELSDLRAALGYR